LIADNKTNQRESLYVWTVLEVSHNIPFTVKRGNKTRCIRTIKITRDPKKWRYIGVIHCSPYTHLAGESLLKDRVVSSRFEHEEWFLLYA
jgi:hypothetical protein